MAAAAGREADHLKPSEKEKKREEKKRKEKRKMSLPAGVHALVMWPV